jgi:hypothetical protein
VARVFEPAAIDFAGAARVIDAQPIVAQLAPVARVGFCGGAGCLHEFFAATSSLRASVCSC